MQAQRFAYVLVVPLIAGISHNLTQQDIVQWELTTPVLVLGSPAHEAYLDRPIDFVAGNGDTIYVLDEGDKRVVAFGQSSEVLFSFGRQGQGPGEFERPQRIEFQQGVVYVLDSQLNRLIMFDSKGMFKESRQLDHTARDFALDGDSVYLATFISTALLTEIRLDKSLYRPESPILQLPNTGEEKLSIREFSYRTARSYVIKSDDILVYVEGAEGRIAALSLRDRTQPAKWTQLKSQLIDDYFVGFRRRQAHLPDNVLGLSPSWCRHVSWWPNSGILVQIFVGMQTPEARLVAVVFDPTTGEERGVRISASYRYLGNMKLLGGNRIAGINNAESTVQVFKLPAGWREWGGTVKSGLVHYNPRRLSVGP